MNKSTLGLIALAVGVWFLLKKSPTAALYNWSACHSQTGCFTYTAANAAEVVTLFTGEFGFQPESVTQI